MAQTKASRKSSTKAKASDGKAKASPKARPKKAKPKARPASKSQSKVKAKARSRAKAAPSRPQATLNAAEETARDAGGKVVHAASRAKVPLMAGGAALAGAAGGIALGARQAHSKNGLRGIDAKELGKAAKKVGEVGAQIGEVALEVRRARERTNGNGSAHRSPIEVVLQGLTSRGRQG